MCCFSCILSVFFWGHKYIESLNIIIIFILLNETCEINNIIIWVRAPDACILTICYKSLRIVLRAHYYHYEYGEGRWPRGRADVSEPGGPGSIPRLGSRRSSLISIEHAELLRSTPSLVLCCAWLVTMALHVHGGLGQLSDLPYYTIIEWFQWIYRVAHKKCPTG